MTLFNMSQYSKEFLTNASIAIAIILVIFIFLFIIYSCKKNDYEHFSVFLEKNKIYIEIFLIISLSVMSISIATNANIIALNEIEIQKAHNQPIFIFNETRYGNGYYQKLEVYNVGAPLNNFNIFPITFIKIWSYENNKYKEIMIPISYYSIGTRTESDNSELIEFFASDTKPEDGNYYRMSKAIEGFYDISRDNNLSYGMNFDKYVNIAYKDIYGEEHSDLYVVSDLYPHKISSEKKETILMDFNNSMYSLNVEDLTADKLYEIFSVQY